MVRDSSAATYLEAASSEELRSRMAFSRPWTQRPRNSGFTRPGHRRESASVRCR
jgi:hypothetical protein